MKNGKDASRIGWSHVATAVVLVLTGAAQSAWAQRPGRVPDDEDGWLQWVVAAGVAVLILFTAFLNPKRSHLT